MAPTILVTGASGFAGRHTVPALLAKGFQVRGQYSRKPGSRGDIDWRQHDFLASLDFGSLVEGCDGVVHLAAELSRVPVMERVNVEATRALCLAAQSAGARYFGYASSVVVYGSPRRRSVDETTPLIDPRASILAQYYAAPSMLEYARTKVLAEQAIRDLRPAIAIDYYRPTVVAELPRLLEARDWSPLRRLGATYRRTQYIYAPDAGDAIAHLVARGLDGKRPAGSIEAFNICDEACGTFRELLRHAYAKTGDRRYKAGPDIPVILDLLNNLIRYRQGRLRYPLGMLDISNAKLRATGFSMPVGFEKALELALR